MMAEDGLPGLNYADIAKKLLNDRLLLTALELHYELVEAGKELPGLREFFSNPSNFEHSSPQNDNISITLSMGTVTALTALYNVCTTPFAAHSMTSILTAFFSQLDLRVRPPWTHWR